MGINLPRFPERPKNQAASDVVKMTIVGIFVGLLMVCCGGGFLVFLL